MNEEIDQSRQRVEKAIRDLRDDYERQSGILLQKQIERLLERRGLNGKECADVIRGLATLGIVASVEVETGPEAELEAGTGFGRSANEIFNQDRRVSGWNETWAEYETLTRRFGLDKDDFLSSEEEAEAIRTVHLAKKLSKETGSDGLVSKEVQQIIRNGEKSQARLIVSNIRFILTVARQFLDLSSLTLGDLVQEGIAGMIRAIEKFNVSFENRFQTYAVWWIKQSITKAIYDQGSMIRFPANMYWEILLYKRAYRLLHQNHPDRLPTMSELADELVWDIGKVAFLRDLAAFQFPSLYGESQDGEGTALMDRIKSETDGPEELLSASDESEIIRSILDGLEEKERMIMEMRFGLGKEGFEQTLGEIGERMGLTRERIRQIESRAIDKLRRKLGRLSEYRHRMDGYFRKKRDQKESDDSR